MISLQHTTTKKGTRTMAVIRVHKNENYTVMSNRHFKERNMSLKAKGLLSLMLSLPEEWDYSIAGLTALSKDGKDSVMSALEELKKFGYLKMTRSHKKNGHFAGYDYDIYEEPQNVENQQKNVENYVENPPDAEKPNTEEPNTEKPNAENPQQLNTKYIKYINNKDKIDKIDKRKGAAFPAIEPSSFTKELIKTKYIKKDDLTIIDYNEYLDEKLEEEDFKLVRAALWYFIKQHKMRQGKDEQGERIQNKLHYFKRSMENGIRRMKQTEERKDHWLYQ